MSARSCCALLIVAAAASRRAILVRRPPLHRARWRPLRLSRPGRRHRRLRRQPRPGPAAPLSEAELFRRKSLADLNAEHPLADAFFDYNQNILRDDAKQALQQDAQWLAKWPQTVIRIDGHCDERGTAEYNLALGERRAEVVREYLAVSASAPTGSRRAAWARKRRSAATTASPAGRRIAAVTSRSRRSESAPQMTNPPATRSSVTRRKHFDCYLAVRASRCWWLACRSSLALPVSRARVSPRRQR